MIQDNVPLAPLTTLEVGGPARHFCRATTLPQLTDALGWAAERDLPLLVLGGGSNLLISDEGFPGLVIQMAFRGVEMDGGRVRAAAGEDWEPLVAETVARGWAGLECLSGIPGRVGATPIQNVGAYGQEVRDTLTEVEVLEITTGKVHVFGNAACGFGYRDSRFKREDHARFVVLAVTFGLRPGGAPAVKYPELQRQLKDGAGADLAQVRQTVLELRRGKSMVLDPADPNTRSAGSFFMNPIVSDAEFARLRPALQDAAGPDGKPPAFPTGDGQVKLSAAWLIDRAGVVKGYRLGNAGVSSRHCLALVNWGGAAARDIVRVAREVRTRVQDRFGITLVPEPVFVGVTLD